MNLVSEVRRQIRAFAEGRLTADEFEDWFIPAIWDLPADAELGDEGLIDAVTVLLAEWKDHQLSEADLALTLAALLPDREDFWVPATASSTIVRELRIRQWRSSSESLSETVGHTVHLTLAGVADTSTSRAN